MEEPEHERFVNFIFWYFSRILSYHGVIKLTSSPVILLDNWLKEGAKFFDPERLRVKAWTMKAWEEDSDIRTVWIVKTSWLQQETAFYNLVMSDEFKNKVKILSTFSDEAHQFGRSATSSQNRTLRTIIKRSHFNVLMTGTIFPLGPMTDASGVLQSLGGPFNELGKWNNELRRALQRMLVRGKYDDNLYNVLALRILIAPFVLRRTTQSTWDGEWVIRRTVARPVAEVLEPYPDDFTETEAKTKYRMRKKELSQTQLMERADRQRFFAWAPLYEEIVRRSEGREESRVRIMEEVISIRLVKEKYTGRLRRFIALVKRCKEQGERFIVVSDRLFPLVLTYYVRFSPKRNTDIQVCKQILRLKMGVLAGTSIWRHSTSDSARAATVVALNNQTLDGIVMTDKVGACGHNLIGANVMIFIGSLYSEAYEHQAIGRFLHSRAND